MTDDSGSGLFRRWARRKSEARQVEEADKPARAAEAELGTQLESQGVESSPPVAESPAAPEPKPPVDPATLPDPETLTEGSDFGAYLSEGVAKEVKRQAMSKLFSLPGYNVRDGLDDYDDDFTYFEPLGDIQTADMRHRQQTQSGDEEDDVEGIAEGAGTEARDAATDAWDAVPAEPTSAVPYRSEGEVLLIGPRAGLEQAAAALADKLTCWQLVVGEPLSAPGTRDMLATFPEVGNLELQGHLGELDVSFERAGERHPVSALAGRKRGFDLVLDLNESPLNQAQLPPPGYFATRAEPEALERALAELPEMVGEFEKPRYFNYKPDICAHGERGVSGCTRCLEVCPADAIISIGERIEVNPNLCQGGGSCTAVCPTGALGYAFPPRETLLGRLRNALGAYADANGQDPCVLFYAPETAPPGLPADDEHDVVGEPLPPWVIPAPVEEVGVVGLDVIVNAFAYGAQRVAVYAPEGTPDALVGSVSTQLEHAGAVLKALGHDASRVGVLTNPDTVTRELSGRFKALPGARATHAAASDKGDALRLALDHLWKQSADQPAHGEMPQSAPFGEVHINGDACTLCMGCVSVCPTRALSDGGESPAVRFTEMNCVQCGMCERACPESAITRSQRLLFDPVARRTPRVLHEEPPFPCIKCGKPFATRSMIDKMTEKLKDHRMFAGDAMDRLKMCEDCRVKDMF